MSDIQHWGSAHDRAELDAHITRGDDPEDEAEEAEFEDSPEWVTGSTGVRMHRCPLPPLRTPGGEPWCCPGCGAEWTSTTLGTGVRLGVWQRTYREQRKPTL